MLSDQLDLWQVEVDALPWGGRSPRLLVKAVVQARIDSFLRTTCGVDNSVIGCPSREAQRIDVDPAQFQLCVSTSFSKEV